MKAHLQAYREIIGRRYILLGSLLLVVLSQAVILFIASDLGIDFLRMQTTFSSAVFLRIAHAWNAAGLMQQYFRHFYLDFVIHPILYGVFISSLMAWTFQRKNISARADSLLLLPFMATAFDLIENNLHLYLLTDLSRLSDVIIFYSGLCSWAKWIIALGCLFGSLALHLPFWRRYCSEIDHVS